MERGLCISKLLWAGNSLRKLLSYKHRPFLKEKERGLQGQNQEFREQRVLESASREKGHSPKQGTCSRSGGFQNCPWAVTAVYTPISWFWVGVSIATVLHLSHSCMFNVEGQICLFFSLVFRLKGMIFKELYLRSGTPPRSIVCPWASSRQMRFWISTWFLKGWDLVVLDVRNGIFCIWEGWDLLWPESRLGQKVFFNHGHKMLSFRMLSLQCDFDSSCINGEDL